MNLSDLATVANGSLRGEDKAVNHLAVDSRAIQPGDVFVALRGEHADGHQFIEDAFQRRAAGVICERPADTAIPQVIVESSLNALNQLAHYYRQLINCPVTAITGSCGKTTTKGMLASILSQQHRVLASQKSFNTALGLPVVLSYWDNQDYAVFEAGTSGPGELSQLSALLKPDIAVITTIGAAHLAGFGDLEGVAHGKSELFESLDPDGVAIINAEAPHADTCLAYARNHRTLTFGLHQSADITATEIESFAAGSTRFKAQTPQGEFAVTLPLLGEHQVSNALAAITAAYELNINQDAIIRGLNEMVPGEHRLRQLSGHRGELVIDDCYNANPQSALSAVKLLASYPGQRILVIGDMGDLGEDNAVWYHQRLGEQADELGVDAIFTIGELARHITTSFKGHGRHFADKESLIQQLGKSTDGQTTVLVKASRSMGLETIVNALT